MAYNEVIRLVAPVRSQKTFFGVILEQFGRAHITQEDLDLLLPRHLLHFGNRCLGSCALGEELGAQTVASDGFRINSGTIVS
jgi:hypothetical protein